MKIRTYTKMMVAVIMASSLLLGACGKKEETTKVLVLARLFRPPLAQKLRHPARSALLLRLVIAPLRKV